MAGENRPVLTVDSLKKQFVRKGGGAFMAVDDVSLTLDRGEMVVLLGPSGCGKTTLLRCIAGLEDPDGGSVHIGSRQVAGAGVRPVAPERREVGMMFQSYALWPHMSVFDNVGYPLAARRTPGAQARSRVQAMLRVVGVDHLAEQFPGQLSGGQQQRVALARCLVASPDLLLFDEPLSNVDAKVREQLRREILDMQEQLGFAGVYVTHDQEEAMRMADRIAVLDSGRIVQLGTPEEIYQRPKTFYVANFVGALNSWETSFEGASGALSAHLEGVGRVPVTAAQCGSGIHTAARERVIAIVRPESVRITHADAGVGEGDGLGEVVREAFVGAHSERVVRLGTGREIMTWSFHRGAAEPRLGDRVRVTVDPESVSFVTGGTGQR